MLDAARIVGRSAWRGGALEVGERAIPEETAIAFTFGGSSYAVMMATPRDLEDFAVGFSLTEGVITAASDIESFEIVEQEIGIELRMRLIEPYASRFVERRRYLAGPTGCGLCGIESLDEAMRTPAIVSDDVRFAPADIMRALDMVTKAQALNRQVHAVRGGIRANDVPRRHQFDLTLVGGFFGQRRKHDQRVESGIERLNRHVENVSRRLLVQHPAHSVTVALSGAAIRANHFGDATPGMIMQQLDEALADRAGRAQNRNVEFLHG